MSPFVLLSPFVLPLCFAHVHDDHPSHSSRQVDDTVAIVARFAGMGHQFKQLQHISKRRSRADQENTRGMSSLSQVVAEVSWQGCVVEADEDAILPLTPLQDHGIKTSQRQVGRFTDPLNIKRQVARGVVALDGLPERASQVFVEQELNRHGSIHDFRAGFCR